ncbi:hypothetical protein NKI86_28820 [Mesorhizobium sp. M0320]|uniref:hypothetical protein n=1 Tax=Mesorhizobium sp. M0320 TaxID=2956936 RepID=UPI00333914E1
MTSFMIAHFAELDAHNRLSKALPDPIEAPPCTTGVKTGWAQQDLPHAPDAMLPIEPGGEVLPL